MRIVKNLNIIIALIVFASICIPAQEWPKVLKHSSGVEVTFFQPQVEKFDKINLEFRAAVMIKPVKAEDPVWGAVWIKSKIITDRDTREISLENVEVTDTKFPGQDSLRINELKKFLSEEIPKWELDITIDHLIASLDSVKVTQKEKFKSDPPEIIHSESPAALILIDGDPIFKKLEGSNYEYVVNTAFFIIKDTKNDVNYLKGGYLWYKSEEILDGWEWTKKIPDDLLKFVDSKAPDSIKVDPDTIEVKPKIFIRTKPAELIETIGKPELASVEGTSLLYVKNTEKDILVDINSQMYFILISGRWFQAKSLSGPWSFIEPENLPSDFAKIPKESEMSNILPQVPGTEESKDAILDTQIPQTAKVDRSKTIQVTYDGEPKFDDIEDSDLEYAVNTDKSVIKYENTYYCCDNAVWYESNNPKGPWKVAVSIPDEIYQMSPESPVYNVKYVYVYDSTPDVVYVGYYPGYTGCYVYGGTVIYGTGYYYQPWYGAYYYPRPVTYGFSMNYNPYTGWSFGFGMSFGGPYGWFSIGFSTHPYHGGYWGAGGYHAGYHHGYHQGARAGYYAGYRAGQGDRVSPYADGNRNVYRNEGAGVSTNDRQRNNTGVSTNDRQRNNTGVSTNDRQRNNTGVNTNDRQRDNQKGGNNVSTNDRQRNNNVYTDKQGNVYRNNDNQWEKRDGNNWSDVNKSKDKSTYDRNKQDLDRQYNSRQKSNQKTQNFNQQRSTQSRSFNRGGGGGGRRR